MCSALAETCSSCTGWRSSHSIQHMYHRLDIHLPSKRIVMRSGSERSEMEPEWPKFHLCLRGVRFMSCGNHARVAVVIARMMRENRRPFQAQSKSTVGRSCIFHILCYTQSIVHYTLLVSLYSNNIAHRSFTFLFIEHID